MRRVLSLALVATKPCPPLPCPTTAVCDEKADWAAVGHIKHLKHHFQGMPLNHDFATAETCAQRFYPEALATCTIDFYRRAIARRNHSRTKRTAR